MKENNWRQALPQLDASADDLTRELLDASNIISVPAHNSVFRQGDRCKNYLIVLDGRVKVFTRSENGREIVLYRLSNGDSCVLTTSCLFGKKRYPAEGVTETPLTALAIPSEKFDKAIQDSSVFREIVFSAFSTHLSELIALVEEVAFGKIEVRLAKHLLDHRDDQNTLSSTHQNISTELGSAREVISRQLKEMESKGYIKINRGQINILDISALREISNR
jgi:CRP/FNR family transcriptional regulator